MGKRHHYIPRMLLKNFASSRDERNEKVFSFQIGVDGKASEFSTKNVAVEKYFYGKEFNTEEQLSEIEAAADNAFQSIISGDNPNKHSDLLRKFIWLQSLRTRGIKLAFHEAFKNVVAEFSSSATKTNLQRRIEQRILNEFDEIIAKELPLQLPSERIVFQELMATPGFKRIAQEGMIAKLVKDNVTEILSRLLAAIGSSGIIEETIIGGYQKGINRATEQVAPPESFCPKYWSVQNFEAHKLILGDLCVFAVDGNGGIGSLHKIGAVRKYVILPMAHNKLLIGMDLDEESNFKSDEVNYSSAALAWDYIYSSSGSENHEQIASHIGTREPLVDSEEVKSIVQRAWI